MPELPNIGDLIGDKYEVVRVLGQGGMGAVFEGVHRLTGKRFAIKWMLPSIGGSADAIKRFIREAQVAGRVEHPNVVEVYDLGQHDGSCYMVMELLQGESLRELFDRSGRLDERSIAQTLIPVLRGLDCAHSAGVIHRDLKPENIFLARDQTGAIVPKLLDFGISKLSSANGQVTVGLTRLGQVMGTPHYMPPEQLRGETVDHRVDVYAMGVILYQAVSGQLPFPSEAFSELVIQIATTTPPSLLGRSGVSPQFAAVVERAMARAVEDRFQTAAELGVALEAFADGTSFHRGLSHPFGVSPSSGGSDTVAIPAGVALPTHASQTPLSAESTWEPEPSKKGPPWGLVTLIALLAVGVGALVVMALNAREEGSWASPAAAGQADKQTDTRSAGDDGSAGPGSVASEKAQVDLIPLDLTKDAKPAAGALPPAVLAPAAPAAPATTAVSAPRKHLEPDVEPESNRRARGDRSSRAGQPEPAHRKRRRAVASPPPTPQERVPKASPVVSTPPVPAPEEPKRPARVGRTGAELTVDDF